MCIQIRGDATRPLMLRQSILCLHAMLMTRPRLPYGQRRCGGVGVAHHLQWSNLTSGVGHPCFSVLRRVAPCLLVLCSVFSSDGIIRAWRGYVIP